MLQPTSQHKTRPYCRSGRAANRHPYHGVPSKRRTVRKITAVDRARFRGAIVEALGRYCTVRSFTSVRELIAAARAPRRYERLLH
jgi:hypothetical protein